LTSHLVIPNLKSLRAVQWAKDNPERRAKIKLDYLLRDPQRRIWKAAKDNAKKAGIEFNIEKSDIVIPEVCPVFGKPFVYGDRRWSASIDRIDSDKGYVKGNIQIISNLANRMKSDASPEELYLFASWINS